MECNGSFTFNVVSDASSADIIATEYSDASSKAAGFAETETNALTNHITHVDVKLNTYYLTENDYGYTHNRIVYTAEHELGHAIGLDHDDSEESVYAILRLLLWHFRMLILKKVQSLLCFLNKK